MIRSMGAFLRTVRTGLLAGFEEIGRIGDYWPWRP